MEQLPDVLLEQILVAADYRSWRRAEATCTKFLGSRDRASAARVRALTFRGERISVSSRRLANSGEEYQRRIFVFDADQLRDNIFLYGVGEDFAVSICSSRIFLSITEHTDIIYQHHLTVDPDEATRFEAVESIHHGGRVYTTLPGFYYIRTKTAAPRYLKAHYGFGQLGLLAEGAVTEHRRHRANESHGFALVDDPSLDLVPVLTDSEIAAQDAWDSSF